MAQKSIFEYKPRPLMMRVRYVDGKEKQIEAATLTNECPVVGI